MTTSDPLANYNDPALADAITEAIDQLPGPQRISARRALELRQISTGFIPEPGIDGSPMLVIEVTYVDENGAHLLARLDGAASGSTQPRTASNTGTKVSTPYTDPHWKQVRPAILKRDKWQGQIRLGKCRGQANAVDHIVDWRDGGSWFDAANLRAACTSCNTSQRNTRVAARARAQRGEDIDTDVIVLTPLTWLTPAEEAAYGPLPRPGEPYRRVRRVTR